MRRCTSILPYFPFAPVSIRDVASIKENSRVARLDQRYAVNDRAEPIRQNHFRKTIIIFSFLVIPRAHLFVKIKFSWKST